MGITFSAPIITSAVRAGLTISQNEFVQKYGTYSNNYNLVNQLGKQEQSMIWGFLILFLILFIIFTLFWSKASDNNKKKEKEGKTDWIVKILGLIILFSLGGFGMSGIYLFIYWIIYKVQFFRWFASLPNKAQIVYGSISATRSLLTN